MSGHVIHEHTTVNASPETVWSVVTDIAARADVLHSVKKVEPPSDDGYAVGTTWREDRDIFGHHGTEELHVTECDGMHAVEETRLRHDTIRTVWRVSPFRDGGAKLLCTVTADMRERNAMERLVWAFLGELGYQRTRRLVRRDLADIAAEAERREAGAGRHAATA